MSKSIWAFGWEGQRNKKDGSGVTIHSGIYVVDIKPGLSRKQWVKAILEVYDYLRESESVDYLRIAFMTKISDTVEDLKDGEMCPVCGHIEGDCE